MRRYLVPVIFGFGGFAVLVGLCLWQVQRLEWKRGLIAEFEARKDAVAVALPEAPEMPGDQYLAVRAEGVFGDPVAHVLTSDKFDGPGFRVVQVFVTDGRRVLVDRGYIGETEKNLDWAVGPLTVEGNLVWPNETDSFTPAPNPERNIWFARDVELMAEALGAEPVMISARAPTGDPSPRALPLGHGLPNNHLQYAITWASLAAVWLAMTTYLLVRIRRNTV